jgi:hypothetical protein
LGTGPSASLWDGARRYVRPWRRCFGKSSKFRQVPLQSEASWRVNPRSRTARPVRFRRGEAFGIRSGVGNEFGVVRARARRRRDCRFSSALFSKTARRDDSRRSRSTARIWARSNGYRSVMDVAADQGPGIGRTGMISTDSPGKIVKCGGSGRLAPVRLPVIGATHNGQR